MASPPTTQRTINLTKSGNLYVVDADDETDTIATYASAAGGASTKITLTNAHVMPPRGTVTIANSGTAGYNGDHQINNPDGAAKTFVIPFAFIDNPATKGDITFNRAKNDRRIISHLKGGGVGRYIRLGDKNSSQIIELAALHNIDLKFNES